MLVKFRFIRLKSDRWRRIADYPYEAHHDNGLSVRGGALVWPGSEFYS